MREFSRHATYFSHYDKRVNTTSCWLKSERTSMFQLIKQALYTFNTHHCTRHVVLYTLARVTKVHSTTNAMSPISTVSP